MRTTTATGSWVAVHAGPNWRVWNTVTGQYHRGTDGAVRVYRDADPAEKRAAKLNSTSPAPTELAARAMTYALTGVE